MSPVRVITIFLNHTGLQAMPYKTANLELDFSLAKSDLDVKRRSTQFSVINYQWHSFCKFRLVSYAEIVLSLC